MVGRSASPRRPWPPPLLDRDLLRAGHLFLGQRELDHAVCVLGLGLVLIDVMAQRKAAKLAAIIAFAADNLLAPLLFLFLLHFGADRYLVAIDRYFDVLLLHARDFRVYPIGLVVLGKVHLALRLFRQALPQRPRARDSEHVF